jgi:hypothetical protein
MRHWRASVATEALSPYFRAAHAPRSEEGTTRGAVKSAVAEALFAFGGEVISRPSATGQYLVPNLEVELEAADLAHGFGTRSPRVLDIQFNTDRGEVIVRLIVPEDAVEQAVSEMQHASRSIWNLGELSGLARGSAFEAGRAAGRALAEAAQVTPKVIAETAQITAKSLAETAKRSSVLSTGARAMPAPAAAPAPETSDPLPADASVAQLATRLSELTGLHDDQLAQLFFGQGSRERVSREHYQRWRTGKKDNPTAGNRRRMWFLVRLFERLAQGEVGIRDWIRNATQIDDLTPFELLRLGRFDEVEHLAARLVPSREAVEVINAEGLPVLLDQGPPSFTPRSEEPTTDLIFEEEKDDWVEIEDETDDE